MTESKSIKLVDPLVLELPNGSQIRIRVGPYGKGITIVPLVGPKSHKSGIPGQRGRRPRPGTIALREQLARDAARGKLRENHEYVKWILQRDLGLSLAVGRQIVYRERRRLDQPSSD